MGAKATFWAWRQEVASGTKLVLLALGDTADDDGTCWPGRKRLAAKCGMTDRSITTHIATLVGMGLVTVTPRTREDGSQASNLYHLNMQDFGGDGGNGFHPAIETVSTLDPTQSDPTPETVLKNSATTKGPDVEKLASEFAATFSEAEVQEHIADSLAHKNAGKWNDKTRYCRNWLKRAAEDKQRRGATNGTQRPNPSLSQFTRGAGSNQAPAGQDSEWWRRVGRYQQGD